MILGTKKATHNVIKKDVRFVFKVLLHFSLFCFRSPYQSTLSLVRLPDNCAPYVSIYTGAQLSGSGAQLSGPGAQLSGSGAQLSAILVCIPTYVISAPLYVHVHEILQQYI